MSPIVNAVIVKLLRQQDKGLAKYGVPVSADRLTLIEWLQHAQEEAIDHAIYLETAIQKLKEENPSENG